MKLKELYLKHIKKVKEIEAKNFDEAYNKAKIETKDETVFTITNTHKSDEAPKTGDSSHTRD